MSIRSGPKSIYDRVENTLPLDNIMHIRFGSLNIAGMLGNTPVIDAIFYRYQLDFLFISETWTSCGKAATLHPSVVFAQEFGKPERGKIIMVSVCLSIPELNRLGV